MPYVNMLNVGTGNEERFICARWNHMTHERPNPGADKAHWTKPSSSRSAYWDFKFLTSRCELVGWQFLRARSFSCEVERSLALNFPKKYPIEAPSKRI
jgi:hypothetical protein